MGFTIDTDDKADTLPRLKAEELQVGRIVYFASNGPPLLIDGWRKDDVFADTIHVRVFWLDANQTPQFAELLMQCFVTKTTIDRLRQEAHDRAVNTLRAASQPAAGSA